jgi:hypothetical protein
MFTFVNNTGWSSTNASSPSLDFIFKYDNDILAHFTEKLPIHVPIHHPKIQQNTFFWSSILTKSNFREGAGKVNICPFHTFAPQENMEELPKIYF